MFDQDCACPWRHPPGEDEFRHAVSIVAPGVAVTGQPSPRDAVPPAGWDARDVRLVIDVTDDGSPFTRPDSAMRRVWLPTPDDGTPRDPRWFLGTEPDEARVARLETRRAELLAILRERIVGGA